MKLSKITQLFCLVVFMWTTTIMAQNNTYKWAKSVGTTTADASQSITVDASGNIYTTGYFQGTVDFDPGSGVTNLTTAGGNDIFITKFNTNGNLIWAKSIGGTSSDISYSIGVDATGNVYTTGYFGGTADFDPSGATANLTTNGSFDFFISKLDSNGNFVWAKNIGSTSNDAAFGLKLDASGNIYLTGYFGGTVDFDPNEGVANLTHNGGGDTFVCKLDTNGNYVWAKSMGGTSPDQGNAICIDSSGNVYFIGTFTGTVDFDLSANTANMISGVNFDLFICKFNTNGEYVWAKKFESATAKSGSSITVDNNGSAYIAGIFAGTVDFDPSASTANLTSNGGNDNFICKLNANGEYVWSKSFGGSGAETITSIALDSDNNIYTTGSYTGTVDLDPNAAADNFVAVGGTDIFINKLDANGNYVWSTSFGGTSADKGTSLVVDSSGNVITTGTYSVTVDFNPGASVANLTSSGSTDVFFSKLGTCVPVFTTDTQTSCGNFVWHGTTYTTSNNTATWSSTNEGGCTDVATLNLTITGAPNTWTGATNNIWNEASNWSCGVVPDTSNDIVISSGSPILNIDLNIPVGKSITISGTGSLTIAPGKTLTIAGSADFGGKSVIFQSDATGSGQFGPLTGTVTGANNIQVERYIPARRAFRFLSPSVTTTTTIKQNWQENGGSASGLGTHITGAGGATNGFDVTATNNPSLFTFDNGTWTAVANTNVNVLTAGTPYRLMVRGDRSTDLTSNTPTATATTLRATGALKTGNYTPTLNQSADGFSLIGNPYQAPIDIKAILTASTNMSSNVVYYWDPTLNARGGYVTRDLTTDVNDVTSSFNQYVQPGQAVFVKKDNTANVPTMTITEANKSIANAGAGVFRNSNTSTDFGLLRVNLQANNQTIEGALALFDDNYTWNVTSEDATKMSNLDEEVSFVQNNTNLAIALQSNPSATSELPIRIDKMRHTNYQWQFELNNYSGASPYLFDTLSNSYTQINNGTVVPFTADLNTTNRFKIVFQNSMLSIDDFAQQIVLYPNPAKAGASFYVDGITEATVTVYNMLGQVIPVQTKSQDNTLQVSPKNSLNKGVYMVNITMEGKTKQVKWIVE
jgi:biopolymer transport protein ExbD